MPLGIYDLNLTDTQINIAAIEFPSLHWAQTAGVGQPEIGAQGQRQKRIPGTTEMVYRRKDAAHLCIGKDVRNKNIPACHKPIRDTVCLFSNRVQIQLQEKYVWDVNDVIPEKLQSSLVYQDVFPGIDLLYTAFGYNIKEQIVVNEPQNSYRFDFLLETNGLSAVLNSDGSVSFLDENGEAHYEIPAPYMVDAIGVYSDQVSFTLSEDARGYVLTVEADKEWINAEDREFPVNIDPTLAVISGQALQDIYSVYTMEAAPNDTTLGRQWLYVGGTALQHLQ